MKLVKEKLRDTLRDVMDYSGDDFSGIGLIIYTNDGALPIFPLRESMPAIYDEDIIPTLVNISSSRSKYHDGFHMISVDWKLTHVSQYFSPPIVNNSKVDYRKLFGGRYLAALFGSALPGVLLTGISSKGFGLAVFEGGEEILFERYD